LNQGIPAYEMVAEIFPHFEGNEIPDFGKDNLWFL
jgi:hypothetical protein